MLPLGALGYVTARLLGEVYIVRHDTPAGAILPPTFAGILIRSANAGLLRMAMLMTPLGLAIGLLAALLP